MKGGFKGAATMEDEDTAEQGKKRLPSIISNLGHYFYGLRVGHVF